MIYCIRFSYQMNLRIVTIYNILQETEVIM